MDQYCIVHHKESLEVGERLMDFVEQVSDMWDDEDSVDVASQRALIAQLSTELEQYFNGIEAADRDLMLQFFCALEVIPLHRKSYTPRLSISMRSSFHNCQSSGFAATWKVRSRRSVRKRFSSSRRTSGTVRSKVRWRHLPKGCLAG